jgi:voltage-gated potassium channel
MSMQHDNGLQRLRHDPTRREELRARLDRDLALPMALVSLLLVLLVYIELSGKTDRRWHEVVATGVWVLWVLVVLQLVAQLILAPNKGLYLRRHWADVLAVVFPFVGVLKVVPLVRTLLVVRLAVFGGRGVGGYLAVLKKRHLGRLALVSALVVLIAAALEDICEVGAPGSTITTLGAALWWAAATLTTVGSQLYPVTRAARSSPSCSCCTPSGSSPTLPRRWPRR